MGTGLAAVGTYRVIKFAFGSVNAAIRMKYLNYLSVDIPRRISTMRRRGYSAENIAQTAVVMRNPIKMETRALMSAEGPAGMFLAKILEIRNLRNYRHPIGPDVNWYLRQNQTYEDIIQSALRSSERVNRTVGVVL